MIREFPRTMQKGQRQEVDIIGKNRTTKGGGGEGVTYR